MNSTKAPLTLTKLVYSLNCPPGMARVAPLGPKNVVYGSIGSGKSTLANALRSSLEGKLQEVLEKGDKPSSTGFAKAAVVPYSTPSGKVRVVSRTYMEGDWIQSPDAKSVLKGKNYAECQIAVTYSAEKGRTISQSGSKPFANQEWLFPVEELESKIRGSSQTRKAQEARSFFLKLIGRHQTRHDILRQSNPAYTDTLSLGDKERGIDPINSMLDLQYLRDRSIAEYKQAKKSNSDIEKQLEESAASMGLRPDANELDVLASKVQTLQQKVSVLSYRDRIADLEKDRQSVAVARERLDSLIPASHPGNPPQPDPKKSQMIADFDLVGKACEAALRIGESTCHMCGQTQFSDFSELQKIGERGKWIQAEMSRRHQDLQATIQGQLSEYNQRMSSYNLSQNDRQRLEVHIQGKERQLDAEESALRSILGDKFSVVAKLEDSAQTLVQDLAELQALQMDCKRRVEAHEHYDRQREIQSSCQENMEWWGGLSACITQMERVLIRDTKAAFESLINSRLPKGWEVEIITEMGSAEVFYIGLRLNGEDYLRLDPSGGQGAIVYPAIASALLSLIPENEKPPISILMPHKERALDTDSLSKAMDCLGKVDEMVLLVSTHPPVKKKKGWNYINMDELPLVPLDTVI